MNKKRDCHMTVPLVFLRNKLADSDEKSGSKHSKKHKVNDYFSRFLFRHSGFPLYIK